MTIGYQATHRFNAWTIQKTIAGKEQDLPQTTPSILLSKAMA